ncbi:MAG: ATP-binding cassette domain-containing protein [Spirochaetia bacterium]|nr:ATP-binding cassette domain-containing protein [Spirochaetia bacterium]
MIRLENVSFGYGERLILDGISLDLGFDEKVAILGGSGGGKTTILKLILGLLRPDSGRIIIDDFDITDKNENELREVRRKFSIVFQDGALFDSLSVFENVAFCLREFTKMSESEIEAKVRELLSRVGVEHATELMPSELSGGMHRRVAIARSLAAFQPRMLFFDEATTGLDPINADNICRLMNEICRNGTGLALVTHKVVDALKVAGRFIFLSGGKIIFDGDRRALLDCGIPEISEFLNELRYDENQENQTSDTSQKTEST